MVTQGKVTLCCMFTALMVPAMALAQAAPAPAPNGGGPNPAVPPGAIRVGAGGRMMMVGGAAGGQFKQIQMDFMKQQLGLGDDDWNALQPKIQKVIDARRDAQTGAGMAVSVMNGVPSVRLTIDTIATISTPPVAAMKDVKDATDNQDAKDEEIEKKLAALREAREKANADLAAAQKELKSGLTPRQEAILVTLGILD